LSAATDIAAEDFLGYARGMRYHVLLPAPGRPHPLYLTAIDADDDEQARRLLRERWPGEDELFLMREERLRFVRVPGGHFPT
jgi:hypothetical protein